MVKSELAQNTTQIHLIHNKGFTLALAGFCFLEKKCSFSNNEVLSKFIVALPNCLEQNHDVENAVTFYFIILNPECLKSK